MELEKMALKFALMVIWMMEGACGCTFASHVIG